MKPQVKKHASVVRFGQIFYVVEDIDAKVGAYVTKEDAEKTMIAMFGFTGPCKKSNPSAMAALDKAKAYCFEVTRG